MASGMESTTPSNIDSLLLDATQRPLDGAAQLRAAYACDNQARESEAVAFYDAAWKLGLDLPASEKHGFMIGYGSTLKNVGRLEESERVLRQLREEAPSSGAARVFLALTLHAGGHLNAAIVELLDLALAQKDRDETLKRYERSISFYRSGISDKAGSKTDTSPDFRARGPLGSNRTP